MRLLNFLDEQDKRQQKLNKNYNHSLEGRLTRMYHRMRSRGSKELSFSREEFIEHGKKSQKLQNLFSAWKQSGYKYGKTPTVDRKDYQKGYTLSNIQFLSFDENRKKQSKEYDEDSTK